MNVLLIYKVRLQTHIYKVIRLIDLLAALAAAAHKFFLQVIPVHPKALHHFLKLLQFLWRYGHARHRIAKAKHNQANMVIRPRRNRPAPLTTAAACYLS